MDVVYTWVNPADDHWRAERAQAIAADPAKYSQYALDESRYADHEELKFSLRSLARHATFIRKIFIAASGRPPAWLDRSRDDLVFLRQEDIMADVTPLPSYNSNVIERYLYRIPDLSEKYIYFNDDVLLTNDVSPSDFFDAEGRALVRMAEGLIRISKIGKNAVFDHITHNTYAALERVIGRTRQPTVPGKSWIPLRLRWILQRQLPWNGPAHVAQPFRKSVWPHLEEMFGREIARMAANRFRQDTDVATNVLAHYVAAHRGLAVLRTTQDHLTIHRAYEVARLETLRRQALAARETGLRMLCLNDTMTDHDLDWHEYVTAICTTLFPEPSPWEQTRCED